MPTKTQSKRAIVISCQIQPDKAEEAQSILADGIFPEAKKHEGFSYAQAMIDPQSGKLHSTMVWDSDQARQRASSSSAYLQQLARLQRLTFGGTPLQSENLPVVAEAEA